MKAIFLTILLLLTATALAQEKPKLVSTEDQLAYVRLRARLSDAQARQNKAVADMQTARAEYDKSQADFKDIQRQFAPLVEAMKKKLPTPSKGKVWQPEETEMELGFKEVEAAPEAVPAPTIAEKPKAKDNPPKE